MKLSFSDLLEKKHLQGRDVPIDGLGVVTLNQLSAADAFSCVNASRDLDGEELEVFVATKACHILKGEPPSKKEVEKIRGNISGHSLGQIYTKGLSFVGADHESAEEAEKN